MQQLEVENAGRNSRAFQTVLAVQEVRLLFAKSRNIYLLLYSTISSRKKLYGIQVVEFLITEHISWKYQT